MIVRRLIFALVCVASARADVIAMRPSARVAPDADITLGDVAALEGPAVTGLADTVLVRAADRGARWDLIEAARIRAVLRENGANLGLIELRARTTRVGRAQRSEAPVRVEAPTGPPVETVEDRVRQSVFATLRLPQDRVKLSFTDPDASILATPVAGRIAEIQPSGHTGALSYAVTVYDGDRIVVRGTVRVEAQIRREVAVASSMIDRGAAITPGLYEVETRWTPAGMLAADPAELSARAARTRIEPGKVITLDELKPDVVVERGQIVALHYVSRAVIAKSRARSLGDGAIGDRVELELVLTGAKVTGTVASEGIVVMRRDAAR